MYARRRLAVTLVEALIALAVVSVLAALTTAAVQKVRSRAAAAACTNNFRQLTLAVQGHHAAHGRLPPGVADGPAEPYPFLAWHARLLPLLGEDALWHEVQAAFAVNRDFQANPPHVWLTRPLGVMQCPADGRRPTGEKGLSARGLTSYLGVIGLRSAKPDGCLYLNSTTRLTDVTDGVSNTLLAGERPASGNRLFGWWYAGWGQDKDGEGDMVLGARTKNNGAFAPDCPTGPYRFTPGRVDDLCDAFHFWSLHPGGGHFALCDGSVRFLSYAADPLLPALATRAGGEAVAVPD